MESTVIGKAIDLVLEYTVVPVARQLKYVFCYKSCVGEMKDAIRKLENEKEIVDREKSAAMNNGQLIYHKADDWLIEATKAQDEVSSLATYEESKVKMRCAGQIVNPIARHKLGRKATKKKLAIEDLCNDRPQHGDISYPPPPSGIVDPTAAATATASTVKDGVFRSSSWQEIVGKIMTALKDDRFNVIGLHGMGGVGKSTMIGEVYDQVKRQRMFDEVIRVEVKMKPEVTRIQEEIAFALGLKFENDSPAIRADLLRERLLRKKEEMRNDTEQKKKKTVLIILDDLWVKLDLQEVGIPLGGNDQVQIKLLLTSREKYLLSYKMGAHELIHLDVLSEADAFRMFKFVVGVRAEGVKDDKIIEIAIKCSGLPIVIEATANALKNSAPGEWDTILKRLDNVDVLDKLKVSYDYLPSKESKKLFLICGISRGPNIQVRDLLKYTFGLQLFNRKDSSTLVAATAKLDKLLSALEAASMLLKIDHDPQYIKIHDCMRELAVKIVEEDHPEWAHDVTLSDNCCELPNASELKLLLISCCEGDAVDLQASTFLIDMEQLKVLEFTNMRVALELPSSATQLDYLRNLGTLCLHYCCLDDISMIGMLKGLQILSFRGSDIRKLPIQLGQLIVLKMLDLSDCKKLTHIEPNVLGSLTKLEELNMENSFNKWEMDEEDDVPPRNARLIELKNMCRLSNVRIHIPNTYTILKEGQLFSSKLSMYRIVVGNNGHYRKFSDEYMKCSRVFILVLGNFAADVVSQDWVQTILQTTQVLYLSDYENKRFKSFGDVCTKGFECLKHLRMKDCHSFQYIISKNDNSCTNLESLFVEGLAKLRSLCGELLRHEEAFSKLKVVKVKQCRNFTHLFDFSLMKSRLSQLEEITVKSCGEIQCVVVGEFDNNNNVVTLSNSRKLKFDDLPKFSSFYGGSSSNVLFTGKKVAFPCLESVIIGYLDKLEDIWHPTDPPSVLGNLRILKVQKCNKLVCAINSNVLLRLQRDLELLSIVSCESMKQVFDVDDGHNLVLFSRLNKLELFDLVGNLMMMKGGMSSSITIFPNIESLRMYRCSHLRYALCCSLPTNAEVGRRGVYENLKEIEIGDCGEMEAIIAATGLDAHHQNYDAISYAYSSLQKMMIDECPQLRTFGQYLCSSDQYDSAAYVDLPFFSQKEIFPCLESLDFEQLSKLGEIWPYEVHHQSSFNMLKQVRVKRCAELSVVFPSTLIPLLENLTELDVSYCDGLIQIIMDVGGSNSRTEEQGSSIATTTMTMEMMFTFPRLIRLLLSDLPKLDRFYSSASESGFQFPSLKTLEIKRCMVETLFIHNSSMDMAGALFRSCDKQLAIP